MVKKGKRSKLLAGDETLNDRRRRVVLFGGDEIRAVTFHDLDGQSPCFLDGRGLQRPERVSDSILHDEWGEGSNASHTAREVKVEIRERSVANSTLTPCYPAKGNFPEGGGAFVVGENYINKPRDINPF